MLTQSEIIEMAREAGLKIDGDYFSDDLYRAVLTRFAKMVAEREREACAKRASVALLGTLKTTSDRVLTAIRARGQQ